MLHVHCNNYIIIIVGIVVMWCSITSSTTGKHLLTAFPLLPKVNDMIWQINQCKSAHV